ncbi:MAG: hypothetical protein U0R51_10000 [Solirubrobacterales bacterium]
MKFHIGSGRVRGWAAVAGTAAAIGAGLLLAGSAQAATVDCGGSVDPLDGGGPRAFEYSFSCTSPQGIPEQPTTIDAYSIVSTKDVIGFNANALVYDPAGEVVGTGESFGCEGPFPGSGFGCNGKMSLGNTAVSDFELTQKPCSRKGVKTPFRVWVVVAADRINESTLAHTKTISEPFRLKVPKCEVPKPDRGHKGGKHHS